MQYHYFKKGGLYLHVKQQMLEDYQDYCDVNAMLDMRFVFLPSKDGAKKCLTKYEADTYLAKNKRKLKGVEIKLESTH